MRPCPVCGTPIENNQSVCSECPAPAQPAPDPEREKHRKQIEADLRREHVFGVVMFWVQIVGPIAVAACAGYAKAGPFGAVCGAVIGAVFAAVLIGAQGL